MIVNKEDKYIKDALRELSIETLEEYSELKRRYHQLAKAYHPDNFQLYTDKNIYTEKMKKVNTAYDKLKGINHEVVERILFANGVKPWLDLPILFRHGDKDVARPYKLVAGYGSLNALKTNGITKYWFYEVTEATPTQLAEIAAFENTSETVTTAYKTGVDGIVYHLKNMIAKNHKDLINTEDSISKYLDKKWPGLIPEIKGTIISKAKNAQTKSRRIKTYNIAEVDNWLDDVADQTAKFVHGGKFDDKRNMFGFVGINVYDPFLAAAKKFAETGRKSYVVLHCKSPGKTQTIQDMRKTQLKKLAEFKTMLSRLGMKTNFLTVLGFLPQDTETEKMNLLV